MIGLPTRKKSKWDKLDNNEMKLHVSQRAVYIWESSTGKLTELPSMDTNYIRNCLNKIIRDDWKTDWKKIFQIELTYRQITSIQNIKQNETRRNNKLRTQFGDRI